MRLTFDEFKNFTPCKDTYGLFGYPLGHTMSPELHQDLFKSYGYDADYYAIEVPPEHLEEAYRLAREKLCGFNVTIPYKKDILPLLDEIQEEARLLNSVNTVHFDHGISHGYNTDLLGFTASLQRDEISLSGKTVLLIGYGGAASVMGLHCASKCGTLYITGRNPEKASRLARDLRTKTGNSRIFSVAPDALPEGIDVLVNGTPIGMYPKEGVCPLSAVPSNIVYAFDAIYNPPMTQLLQKSRKIKAKYRDGLYMLLMQGAKAQEIWTGHAVDAAVCDKLLLKLYGEMALKRLQSIHKKQNIVLCGYMGSGKTTIGKKLAKALSLPFVDADLYLEQQEGTSIPEIFDTKGEGYFRDLESRCIRQLAARSGTVIALGGGAVLRRENAAAIKKTGLLVFLNTPFDKIMKNLSYDHSRPMLKAENREERIRTLYQERKKIYHRVSDFSVSSQSIKGNIFQILKNI